METKERFVGDRERYHYDFGECRPGQGWAQVDTAEDAAWYGIWTNPERRCILTYSESDEKRETAADDAEYAAALRRIAEFHGTAFRGIDDGCSDALRERFEKLGLGDLLHPAEGRKTEGPVAEAYDTRTLKRALSPA